MAATSKHDSATVSGLPPSLKQLQRSRARASLAKGGTFLRKAPLSDSGSESSSSATAIPPGNGVQSNSVRENRMTSTRLYRFVALGTFLIVSCVFLLARISPPVSSAAENSALQVEPLRVDRLDPALDRIVPAGAKIERIATGFGWVGRPGVGRRQPLFRGYQQQQHSPLDGGRRASASFFNPAAIRGLRPSVDWSRVRTG